VFGGGDLIYIRADNMTTHCIILRTMNIHGFTHSAIPIAVLYELSNGVQTGPPLSLRVTSLLFPSLDVSQPNARDGLFGLYPGTMSRHIPAALISWEALFHIASIIMYATASVRSSSF
jgi:hypothetical protein